MNYFHDFYAMLALSISSSYYIYGHRMISTLPQPCLAQRAFNRQSAGLMSFIHLKLHYIYLTSVWFHTHTGLSNLQVIVGWNLFLQEHLSQDFISIGDTLHQLLPAVCGLGTEICWDLIVADSLPAGNEETACVLFYMAHTCKETSLWSIPLYGRLKMGATHFHVRLSYPNGPSKYMLRSSMRSMMPRMFPSRPMGMLTNAAL